jgi:hypothetical protein
LSFRTGGASDLWALSHSAAPEHVFGPSTASGANKKARQSGLNREKEGILRSRSAPRDRLFDYPNAHFFVMDQRQALGTRAAQPKMLDLTRRLFLSGDELKVRFAFDFEYLAFAQVVERSRAVRTRAL